MINIYCDSLKKIRTVIVWRGSNVEKKTDRSFLLHCLDAHNFRIVNIILLYYIDLGKMVIEKKNGRV